MKAPENTSRLNLVWAQSVRAERPLAMLLAVTMAAFGPMNFGAQASETVGEAQVSASAADSAGVRPAATPGAGARPGGRTGARNRPAAQKT